MICPNCSTEVIAGMKFCPKCGFDLRTVAAQTEPEAADQAAAPIFTPEDVDQPAYAAPEEFVPADAAPAEPAAYTSPEPGQPAAAEPFVPNNAAADAAYVPPTYGTPYAPAQQPSDPSGAGYPYAAYVPPDAPGSDAESAPVQADPAKRKRLFIILGAALAAAVIVTVLLIVLLSGGAASAVEIRSTGSAYSTLDDGVYGYSFQNGKVLHGAAVSDLALMSPDGQRLICIDEDARLIFYTQDNTAEQVIDEDVESIRMITNTTLFYNKGDHSTYRCGFDGEPVLIGKDCLLYACDTLEYVLCACDGKVFLYCCATDETTELGSYDDYVSLDAVSNSGNVCLWTTKKQGSGNPYQLYCQIGDERFVLYEQNSTFYAAACYNVKESLALVSISGSTELIAIDIDECSSASIPLGGEYGGLSAVSSAAGPLFSGVDFSLDELYVIVDGSSGSSLYRIDSDFDRDKIVSGCSAARIQNGALYYTDNSGCLYYMKLSDGFYGEPEKIASNVSQFDVTRDGKTIYFSRNVDSERRTAGLYAWSIGDSRPEKISANVFVAAESSYTFMPEYGIWSVISLTDDSKGVYYFCDVELLEGTNLYVGTLYYCKNGGSPERIATEVIVYSLNSGYYYCDDVNVKHLSYAKYVEMNDDDVLVSYYSLRNGKSTLIVKSALY